MQSSKGRKAAKPARSWPADVVVKRAVSALIPYARNARTHSPEQVGQIAKSIEEFGWTVPVLIAEDETIIAGHGRVMAANKLGIQEIPVMVAVGWTETQKRAYVLADNKLALNGGWDEDLLKIELTFLSDHSYDLGLTGFADDEISALTAASLIDINAEGGSEESGSGATLAQLKFGTKRASLSPEELQRLTFQFDRYVDETGLTAGFASWLLDGKHVAGS